MVSNLFLHKCTIFLFYYFGVLIFSLYLHFLGIVNVIEQQFLFDVKFNHSYDVIIVGGGTAGLTIANGLDTDNVLIIEAGNDFATPKTAISSTFANYFHTIPLLAPLLQQWDHFDWQYKTTSQQSACQAMNDGVSHWPMGKGVGGTQIINYMIYHRGHEKDFSNWFTNDDDEYDFNKDVLPYFREFEEFIEPGELVYASKLSASFLETQNEAQNFDGVVSAQFIKPKILQRNGRRWTVADAYRIKKRKHHIMHSAYVERILFDDDGSKQLPVPPRAVGVSFKINGKLYEALASKAVILSAGTIGSPSILLKSGIGPAYLSDLTKNKTLNPLKIKFRKNLSAVGQHLQDHVATGLDFVLLNQTMKFEPWHVYTLQQFINYFIYGNGTLTTTGCEALGFVKTTLAIDDLPDLGFMVLPVGATVDAGVCSRHMINLNDKTWQGYFQPLVGTTSITILPIVLHPKSRGSVTINVSADAAIQTIINPQYLTHPDDVEVLIMGLKIIEQLTKTASFKRLGARINTQPFPGCESRLFGSDAYWKCYVEHLTLTAYHPIGTCRMGSDHTDSVVHPSTFRVHGVDQLYVCDASIMPSMPSGNPQAVVGMLAQRFLERFNRKLSQEQEFDEFLVE